MCGGVRKCGKCWYYYFEDINDDGLRKKVEKVGGDIWLEVEVVLWKVLLDIDEIG